MFRVGQNRINTPYLTVYLVISPPEIPFMYGSGQLYTCSRLMHPLARNALLKDLVQTLARCTCS